MAERDIDTLRRARENFVRKRRTMAEQMIPPGAAAAHFAPTFAGLQGAIEAIDRAIADEEKLPPGYAPDQEIAERAPLPGESNVVDVDFDPA